MPTRQMRMLTPVTSTPVSVFVPYGCTTGDQPLEEADGHLNKGTGSVTTASATALHHHMISSGLAASMLVALRNDQVSGYGLIWRMYRGCIPGGVG